SRRRHTRFSRVWSSDVCSSDLERAEGAQRRNLAAPPSPARPFLDGPRIGGPSLSHRGSLIEALASTLSRRRFRGVPVGALVDEPSGDGLCWTLSSNAPTSGDSELDDGLVLFQIAAGDDRVEVVLREVHVDVVVGVAIE